jgi:hypothetical protein
MTPPSACEDDEPDTDPDTDPEPDPELDAIAAATAATATVDAGADNLDAMLERDIAPEGVLSTLTLTPTLLGVSEP